MIPNKEIGRYLLDTEYKRTYLLGEILRNGSKEYKDLLHSLPEPPK